jgi:endonuclease YncB( thermonuclease family)
MFILLMFVVAVVSFFLLLIGLVSPKTVSRIVHIELTRKRAAILFALAFMVATGLMGNAIEKEKTDGTLSSPTSTVTLVVSSTPDTTSAVISHVTTSIKTIATTSTTAATRPTPGKPVIASTPQSARPSIASTTADYVLVTKVIDGDTVELEGGKRLRLIGIDTPESVDPRKPVQCFAKEASARTRSILAAKKVKLVKDVSDTDRYGRLLRYVYLEDGTFVNDLLVREGYARAYTYPPDVAFSAQFKAAEQEARTNGRGLWAADTCNGGTELSKPAPTAPAPAAPTSSPERTGSETPSSTPNVPVMAEPTPQPTAPVSAAPSGHTWYTSSHFRAEYYYCDTDEQWKALSPSYLKSFSSPEALLAKYKRVLHEACKN